MLFSTYWDAENSKSLYLHHPLNPLRADFPRFGELRPNAAQGLALFEEGALGKTLRHQGAFYVLSAEQQGQLGDVAGADQMPVLAPEIGIEMHLPAMAGITTREFPGRLDEDGF